MPGRVSLYALHAVDVLHEVFFDLVRHMHRVLLGVELLLVVVAEAQLLQYNLVAVQVGHVNRSVAIFDVLGNLWHYH